MTGAYLGIRIRWSTAGLCSHQSSDIYTPGCSGAPSYYLWTLEGGIKQQLMRQLTTNASSVCAVTHAACTRTDFLVHREAKEEVTLITNCVHKKADTIPSFGFRNEHYIYLTHTRHWTTVSFFLLSACRIKMWALACPWACEGVCRCRSSDSLPHAPPSWNSSVVSSTRP